MTDLDVKFFPADQVKNGHLGNGYIRSGVCSVRFSAWVNPKFNQGFSLRLPSRKVGDKYQDEASFVNREAQDQVYNLIHPKLAHLLGGNSAAQAAPQAPAQSYSQTAPTQISSAPPAGTGVPKPPF